MFLPLNKNKLVITDLFLYNFSSLSNHAGLKYFFTIHVCERSEEGGSGRLSNTFEISLLAPSHAHCAIFHEVFKTQVVNTARAQDNIDAG